MQLFITYSLKKTRIMTFPNDRDNELQRREKELQEREKAIRLRELEAEIYEKEKKEETPYYQTQRHKPSENSLKIGVNNFIKIVKFVGFVIFGFAIVYVGIQVGMFLTYALIATIVGFVGYKLFLDKNNSK